jgi:hypothetical protein
MEMKHDDLKGLNSYAILPNADQLAHPISLIVNGVHRVLGHESDYHRYPLIGRDSVGFSTPELAWKGQYAKEWLPGRPLSDDPHDFSYPFNQAFIFIAKRVSQKGFVKVALFPENSPTFGKFLCCMDEMKWEPLDSNEFFWHLKPGLNHCSVRIVTRFGWLGHPSSLTVFYKPDLMASPPGQEGSSLR